MSDPSAWQVQKALALWKANVEQIDDEEMEDSYNDGPWNQEEDVYEILANVVRAALRAEGLRDLCQDRITFLLERKARFNKRAERFRRMAADMMTILGEKTKEFHDMTITVNKGRPAFRVIDETVIPSEYKRLKSVPSIDRISIISDLKQGVVIDGVEMTQGEPVLTIRTA